MFEKRYFTPQQVDALIPRLETVFDHIQTCRSRAEELAAQSMTRLESPVPSDVAQTQLLRSQVNFLMEAIQEDVNQIQTWGGITKDIELGLVDFLGDVAGQDVWLCWRKGEGRV